jgi:hypothetical protein
MLSEERPRRRPVAMLGDQDIDDLLLQSMTPATAVDHVISWLSDGVDPR